MAIRYNRSQRVSLENAVNKFNAKISRLKRLDKKLLLPERVSYYDIIDSATSKQDLTRKIESLERFLTRDAGKVITTEGGVKTVNYVVSETQRELKNVKTALTRQIKQIEGITPTIFGRPVDATYKQMGSETLTNLKARRKVLNKGKITRLEKGEFKKLMKQIEINKKKIRYRSQLFQSNYVDKMLFNLAYYVGYTDTEKLNYIKEKLLSLKEDQFLKLFNTEQAISDILDYYPDVNNPSKSPHLIQEEVKELYNELYNSIDSIIAKYQSEKIYS